MSAHVTIVFRFMNQPTFEVGFDGESVKEAGCAAIDDLAEVQLHDLDRIEVQHEDQFLMKV